MHYILFPDNKGFICLWLVSKIATFLATLMLCMLEKLVIQIAITQYTQGSGIILIPLDTEIDLEFDH
ncbi:hypothetical protein DW184_01175 [Enterobacter cloacae]|nr:hypothetical protein DW184_01175 [Enterobacter cloacae]